MLDGRDLRDSTLSSLFFHWQSGELRLQLELGALQPAVYLVARGVTFFSCPRRQPWGPSGLVNAVAVTEEDGARRLRVEMQSGDVVEAVAAEVQLV